ncbi:uncharacterized protein LOC126912755 [Spodoptera frugiperda]|uniref:Uncharacterized protein LOC126912755 n=1 Tax=Spodoptera frugiperda TaxID=7108 RepID=A0A9R0EAY1_SPOFR|nr:uncharacterized protein LOC126912755 [Spodoptera frugiperda]
MACKNLFAAIFVFACFLTCKGEDCEAYDEFGSCTGPCSEDKVLYSMGCHQDSMTERTCRNPVPRNIGVRCDYARCECPEPKIWDEAAHSCVNIEDCSDQSGVTAKIED